MQFQLLTSAPSSNPVEYKAGAKAYYDTFAGMIRCTVLKVNKECNGWLVGDSDELVVRLDETRGAYKRGEVLNAKGKDIVPVKHRFIKGYHYRINTAYAWKKDTH